jgi:hypothetical protein
MIENDEQLRQACEALGDLYQALASYRSKILPVNPRNYAIIAQGPHDQVRKIQAEIDEYLGLHEPARVEAGALRKTPRNSEKASGKVVYPRNWMVRARRIWRRPHRPGS